MSGKLVYAMKVTEKLTMRAYDEFTKMHLPEKIPNWTDPDKRRRLGDSLYDFSHGAPEQRQGVHRPSNAERDLSGEYALLSEHSCYFGDKAIDLPPDLRPVAQNRQGHRVTLNDPYVDSFVQWIEGLVSLPSASGRPLCDLFPEGANRATPGCATDRDEEDLEDLGEPSCS
jgi:hypothetical protein